MARLPRLSCFHSELYNDKYRSLSILMDQKIESNLKFLGLSEKEAKVYVSVLELGASPVLQISQKSGINRPTTYVEIEALIRMGLMSSYIKGKKRYFVAEPPERLGELINLKRAEIRDQQDRLADIMPDLELLFNTANERPIVRFYEGREGIKAINSDIFKRGGKEVLTFYSSDFYEEFFGEGERAELRKLRERKGITARSLYTRKSGVYDSPPPKGISDRFIPEDRFPFFAGIDIYDNKMAIHSLKGKIVGAIIESNYVADTMRSIFELAWEAAEKYQK